MSDMRDEMLRTLDRIVEDTVVTTVREKADGLGSGGAFSAGGQAQAEATAPLWAALEEAGITGIGAGGDDDVAFSDCMELIRRAGHHALPVPLAETIMARRMLSRVGMEAPDGAITLAPPGASEPIVSQGHGFAAGATAKSVPYASTSAHCLVASNTGLHLLDISAAVSMQGTNMAGEPRDMIDLGKARVVAHCPLEHAAPALEAEGALARATQLAGAMGAATEHALIWVNDRIQFGRPIAKHQAVQHLMAQLAEEMAAAGAAADLAIAASQTGPDRLSIAIAKARTGEAAGKGANIVHALFGAMGFTREHALHYTTRRLWAWRNEFGSEVYWQGEIGRAVAAKGGRSLWTSLTREM
ncbi:MAG: acyl-CoA dehydrogenase family protein [Hyphomicrobiaceae bacterium]